MRENEPVLFVLSVCDREIILEKGEILSEKRQTVYSLSSLPLCYPCTVLNSLIGSFSKARYRRSTISAKSRNSTRRFYGRVGFGQVLCGL